MGIFRDNEPTRAQAGDQLVHCGHCGNDHFWSRTIVLNSGTSELFGFAWASPEATVLICSQCGMLMHFLPDYLALEKRK